MNSYLQTGRFSSVSSPKSEAGNAVRASANTKGMGCWTGGVLLGLMAPPIGAALIGCAMIGKGISDIQAGREDRREAGKSNTLTSDTRNFCKGLVKGLVLPLCAMQNMTQVAANSIGEGH